MSVPVYPITFSKDHPPYAAGEVAAFPADQAAALFVAGVGTLSSEDQITIAAAIAAAKMANPLKPVAVVTVLNPDGSLSTRLPNGQIPPYGN